MGAAGAYTARQLKGGVVDALKAGLLTQARLMSHLIASELLQPDQTGRLQLLAHRLGAENGTRGTVIQVGGRLLFQGSPCPLCSFPTYRWMEISDREVIEAIQADYPRWEAEQGACERCVDLYPFRVELGGS